jgi:hypothetical protein
MTIPFVCDGASVVFLEPSLHGGWWWAGFVLVVAALFCAVAASLWAPVAGPFVRSEEHAGSRASVAFIGLSGIVVLCVVFGLAGMQMPLGCSTHAILVSATIPASSEPDARRLADEARGATAADRAVRDLGGVRDAVLGKLLPNANVELSPAAVARGVRDAIADATRYGFPGSAPAVRTEALAKFDSSVIEGIEIALLMGWRSLYSGDKQNLTYVVSNRSEQYGWNWQTFRNKHFGPDVLKVVTVGAMTSGAPVLVQPVRTFIATDASSLVVEAVFATNGTASSATIHLTGTAGEIGTATVAVPASGGTTTLARIVFSGLPGLRDGDTLRQQTDVGTVVRRLPPPLPDRITLDLRYDALRGTLDFLAGRTTSCGGTDLAAQVGEWRNTFSRVQDASPTLGAVGHQVALVPAPFGGILVLPAGAGFGANTDLAHLGLAEPPVRPLATPGRVVAWGTTAAPRRYDLDRLGIDGARIAGTLAPANASVPVAVALVSEMSDIAAQRLDRGDVGNAAGAGLVRVALPDPDPDKRSLRHRAAALLGDPVALGVVCGKPIRETELFLAYWHAVLDAVAAAGVPVVELSPLETAPSQALPAIYLDAVAQQQIASARLELPLLMLTGALLIYVSLMVLAYLRALRVFAE